MFLYTLIFYVFLCIFLPDARVIAQASDNYAIQNDAFSTAGHFSTSAHFQIDDCVGQPSPVGGATSANFTLSAGFLSFPFIEPAIPPDNKITNGDFSNNATGWTLNTFESAQATGSIQNGEYAISISNGSNQYWHIELQQAGILIEKGKKYDVSFDAYASSPRRIHASVGRNSDPWTPYSNFNHIELTTSKQSFTYSFVMNSETDPAARILFQCGTSSADVKLDNIVLSEGVIDLTKKRYDAPQLPATVSVPTIDGELNDTAWLYAGDVEALSIGGWPENWHSTWMNFSNNCVQWRALWSAATNLLYIMVEVQDDVAGEVDHPYNLLWADDCIEFFTDGDHSGGLFNGSMTDAQGWMIRCDNTKHLNYSLGEYTGSAVTSAVWHGNAGNWILEAAIEIYDRYESNRKQLQTGDVIGWDVWYDDSDNMALDGNNYGRDRQVGWGYTGQAYNNADYMHELEFGDVGSISDIEESQYIQIPEQFMLNQNYPNPFNPVTVISWQLPVSSHVDLSIYNVFGQKVSTLISKKQSAGNYQIEWNASGFSSGIYFYKLHTGIKTVTRKMILLK
jgi:hypothetical protein